MNPNEKIGETIKESFETYAGVIQDNCLKTMFYWARFLIKPIIDERFSDNTKMCCEITYPGTSKQQINKLEKKVPEPLKKLGKY